MVMFRVLLVALLVASGAAAPCESPTTTEAPCTTTTTTVAPCEVITTTAAPCPTTTEATTTEAPCTTTTTEAPCITTTTEAPCTTTTTAAPTTTAPCSTTTTTVAPCESTTTTVAPCSASTTTTASPCHGAATTTTAAVSNDNEIRDDGRCPDGWTRFNVSCYFVERDNQASLKEAEASCLEKRASLFVPNSEEEFTAIYEKAPFNTWTWLGLRKAANEEKAKWHYDDAMDIGKLNWLINNPYGDAVNGWSSAAECAAHWNPAMDIGKYSFYYPCDYKFHYVCERNSSILHQEGGLKLF